MPQLDGWQVCREIRKKSACPIIMLTAKGEVFDKVLGLELGADDYVVKPFETKEVIARIKAVLRRSGAADQKKTKEVSYDGLYINMEMCIRDRPVTVVTVPLVVVVVVPAVVEGGSVTSGRVETGVSGSSSFSSSLGRCGSSGGATALVVRVVDVYKRQG